MNLKEKLAQANAAAQAKAQELKAKAATTKPRIRVAAILGDEVKPRPRLVWPTERQAHKAGEKCPHCNGTGRYRFHTDHARNEKCYRCDGKGTLNAKDLSFYHKRVSGGGPLNLVMSA